MVKRDFRGKAHRRGLARKVQKVHYISGKEDFCPKSRGTLRAMSHKDKSDDDILDPSKDSAKSESISQKFGHLSESNFFWGGGVGMVFVAYGFLLAGALKMSIALLFIGWAIITISIYSHNFFEGRSKRVEVIGQTLISGFLAIALVLIWLSLRPQAIAQPQPQATSAERIIVDVEPQYLIKLFDAHTDVQAKKLVEAYIGKWLVVSGEVVNVIGGEDEWSVFIKLHPNDPKDFNTYIVGMYFREKKWIDRIAVLRRGDKITAVGQIEAVDVFSIRLNNCELTDPTPPKK
jgi:hypothetical protein